MHKKQQKQELDSIVQIELKNGDTLYYRINPATETKLQTSLSHYCNYIEQAPPNFQFVSFMTYRDRIVLISTAALSRLILRHDSSYPSNDLDGYVDNFSILPSEQELKDADADYGPVPEDGEQILPHVIIYHDGDNKDIENPFIFNDVDKGELSLTMPELKGELIMPRLFSVINSFGGIHYVPSQRIICMEMYMGSALS